MNFFLLFSIFLLLTALPAIIFKLVRGPTMADRLVSGNMAVSILTFVLALAGTAKGSELYHDAALVAALLSFSSAIIIAKYITTGRVM